MICWRAWRVESSMRLQASIGWSMILPANHLRRLNGNEDRCDSAPDGVSAGSLGRLALRRWLLGCLAFGVTSGAALNQRLSLLQDMVIAFVGKVLVGFAQGEPADFIIFGVVE